MKTTIFKNCWPDNTKVPIEVDDEEALRYGIVLTDDNIKELVWENQWGDDYEFQYVRIRTISYDDHLYYHCMVDGIVTNFKELI